MAETMNDNLKGKLTILGSALEGLGIEMYEEFEQPFKEAAETAIKSVDTISYSLKMENFLKVCRQLQGQ